MSCRGSFLRPDASLHRAAPRALVSGLGPVPYIAQNGVQISRGATATVESNRIADNWYTGSADAMSCGLLLFEADGVKQKRNVFVANEQDVCNFGRGGGGTAG